MKINETKPAASVSALKKAKKAAGAGGVEFSRYLSQAEETESASAAAPVAGAAPMAPVNALLALQEMPEEHYRDRKAAAQGRATLDRLEELRHGLLTGAVAPETLRGLESSLALHRAQAAYDPRLKAALEEIELRAAVELAKLERARDLAGDLARDSR